MTENRINPKVDVYLNAGCGRCPLGNTPECKVNFWQEELETLRTIILECGLTEELKWGVPVYTSEKNNVVLISALNDNCVISFPKGALLKDKNKILTKPGENSQAGRVVRLTSVQQIIELEDVLTEYILEAVEVEKAGLKVKYKETSEYEIPEELQNKFNEDPAFQIAFNQLTPGRQRGYLLYFAQPKQSKTREARIERSLPRIFIGKGVNDY